MPHISPLVCPSSHHTRSHAPSTSTQHACLRASHITTRVFLISSHQVTCTVHLHPTPSIYLRASHITTRVFLTSSHQVTCTGHKIHSWGYRAHTHTHTHTHLLPHLEVPADIHFMNVIPRAYVCKLPATRSPLLQTHIHAHTQTHTQSHTHTHTHTHTHVRIYTHMHMHCRPSNSAASSAPGGSNNVGA